MHKLHAELDWWLRVDSSKNGQARLLFALGHHDHGQWRCHLLSAVCCDQQRRRDGCQTSLSQHRTFRKLV
jgi:hypothetical protein